MLSVFVCVLVVRIGFEYTRLRLPWRFCLSVGCLIGPGVFFLVPGMRFGRMAFLRRCLMIASAAVALVRRTVRTAGTAVGGRNGAVVCITAPAMHTVKTFSHFF